MNLERFHNSVDCYLRHFQSRTEVLEVFEALWPQEFRALGVTSVSPLPDRVRAYRTMLDLLSEKMPVAEDGTIEESDEIFEDEFLSYLPLDPQGRMYEEIDPAWLRLSERVVLAICDPDYHDPVGRVLVQAAVPLEAVNSDNLQHVCQRAAAPLKYLWDAWAWMYGQTGNYWLDISPELYWESEKPEWGVQVVRHLMADWEQARPIIAHAVAFDEWLQADLRRVSLVEKLLKEAAAMQRVRIRIGGPQPAPLVETLGGILDDEEDYDDED